MATKTLIMSRHVKLFPDWTKYIKALGYGEILFTDKERDGLFTQVTEYKPDILLFGCGFYSRATPYMMRQMMKRLPQMNVAAVNIHDFPDDLGMHFIVNGVNSYVNMMDGMEEFAKGLKTVWEGGTYIAEGVTQRLDLRLEAPKPASDITEREMEVLQLVCCGFTDNEMTQPLDVSRRTVCNHKASLYEKLNVRNTPELMLAAFENGLVDIDKLNFYPKGYTVKPQPLKELTA